jgi:hypothetical protein
MTQRRYPTLKLRKEQNTYVVSGNVIACRFVSVEGANTEKLNC